jgi:hypothetical protein
MAKGKKGGNQNSPRKGYSSNKGGSTMMYAVLGLVSLVGVYFLSSFPVDSGGGGGAVSYDNDLPWLKGTATKCESCKVVVTSSVASAVKQVSATITDQIYTI